MFAQRGFPFVYKILKHKCLHLNPRKIEFILFQYYSFYGHSCISQIKSSLYLFNYLTLFMLDIKSRLFEITSFLYCSNLDEKLKRYFINMDKIVKIVNLQTRDQISELQNFKLRSKRFKIINKIPIKRNKLNYSSNMSHH